MKIKILYELFIGLLSLMAAIMIILDLMYKLPLMVVESFYYINLIICIVFLLDYFPIFLIYKNLNIYLVFLFHEIHFTL